LSTLEEETHQEDSAPLSEGEVEEFSDDGDLIYEDEDE
jgi:hypothetical protein